MVISCFDALKTRLHHLPPRPAVVAAAHDEHTLQAVFAAQQDGLISPILVGNRAKISAIGEKLEQTILPEQIVDGGDEADCAQKSVALIREGRGKLLVKGMLQTGTLLHAAVQKDVGIRASQVMSHVAILEVPSYHKLIFDTDGGMNIAPDLEQKRHILRNVLDFCRFLGYDQPKAAVLCAVETVNPHMPETLDAAALKEAALHGDFGPCVVDGPLSLDLATDREAARLKGYQSPVAGDADILLCPSITVGNVLGKALYGLAGGHMAGVVLGASVPITVNSRGATAEEKYSSILICSALGGEFHVI